MKILKILSVACLTPFLMANQGGCDGNVPTVEQIELNLPTSIRNCKHAPKSPGRASTGKQRARYIVKLYDSWEECHGDLQTVNVLYKKWRGKVEALK